MTRQVWRYLLVCALGILTPLQALCQIIDRIDIQRRGETAEIQFSFSTQVRYIRHAPQSEGRDLRIFLSLTGSDVRESDLKLETKRSPRTDLVPGFVVSYPELSNALRISFDRVTRFQVRQGPDPRSLIVTVPAIPGAHDDSAGDTSTDQPGSAQIAGAERGGPQEQQSGIPPSTTDNEVRAKDLMHEAQQALGNRLGTLAIIKLNEILNLPPNRFSQRAQALAGQARELSGELARARAEYQLYLKLYPEGEETASVKERLAALDKQIKEVRGETRKKRGETPSEWIITGGVSQYYYTGKSQIEVITPPPPGQLTFNVDTLSLTDQKALISTIDVLARKREDALDSRLVFRDADSRNFLPGQKDRNRLNAAYFEQTNKEVGTFFRIGRQTASSGGIFNRFDGAALSYNLDSEWKLSAAFGYPVEFGSLYEKKFYSTSIERLPQLERLGFTAYLMDQRVDGVPDRRAIGVDARYFDSSSTYYGLVDYDLSFGGINILMAQGNWRLESGTNVFSYYDFRRSPPYSVINALAGETSQSIVDLNQAIGIDELRRRASTLTANSNMFSIGLTHPVSEKWQLGADYRLASIGPTGASGTMPAQPGSGSSHVYSGQAIGNNLWLDNDIALAIGSLILAPTYKGESYGLLYGFTFRDNWRIDGNLRYYTQLDNLEQRQNRLSPSLKLGYRWKDSVTFELEVGGEIVAEDGPQRTMNSTRNYIWGGYRWDFR